tara:strand:+ start:312 stop:1073 length:762 start_codon:yes stop_codon:yes gene_type:complete
MKKELFNAKQIQLLLLKDKWGNLKDYDFFNWANSLTTSNTEGLEKFSTFNPGQKIGIVNLYDQGISSFACHSERDFLNYSKKHNYTLYTYRDSLDRDSYASWSKARSILNHIKEHDYLIWLDSDIIIFNEDITLESIIESSSKSIIASKDIGGHCFLNSGVLFFKNDDFSVSVLKEWNKFRGNKSSLHSDGGDQKILSDIILGIENHNSYVDIHDMSKFNTDPRAIDFQTFILHFMSYPKCLKDFFIHYWNSN